MPSLVDMFKGVPSSANSICNLHFFPFQFCGSSSLAFMAALIARAYAPHSSWSSQRPELQLPVAVVLWHPEGCNGAHPAARFITTTNMTIFLTIAVTPTPWTSIHLITATLVYSSVIPCFFSTTNIHINQMLRMNTLWKTENFRQ